MANQLLSQRGRLVGGVFLLCVLCPGLGCNKTESSGKESKPFVQPASNELFKLTNEEELASNCEVDTSSPGDLIPAFEELKERIGDLQSEFIVLMKKELESPYPSPGDRNDSSVEALLEDPIYIARATEVANAQACAVLAVKAIGGSYIQSFLLINAFTASLTADQARQLSQRRDVSAVQLSQEAVSPPS